MTKTDDKVISGREVNTDYYERGQKAMNKLKILGFIGMVLGFGGTIVTSIANEKTMKNEVAKQVAEASLKNK